MILNLSTIQSNSDLKIRKSAYWSSSFSALTGAQLKICAISQRSVSVFVSTVISTEEDLSWRVAKRPVFSQWLQNKKHIEAIKQRLIPLNIKLILIVLCIKYWIHFALSFWIFIILCKWLFWKFWLYWLIKDEIDRSCNFDVNTSCIHKSFLIS